MNWLVASLVVSVVLTIVLNVAIRAWPGAAERTTRQLHDRAQRQQPDGFGRGQGRVRVIVPWRSMLLASIGLTIVVNILLRLA